jgi:two-component system OmpR family response regulator
MQVSAPIVVEIIENNPNLSSLLGWHLYQVGYQVCQAVDLSQGYLTYQRYRPHLVVLSTELGQGYLELCATIFSDRQSMILLTGTRPHELDIVAGLKAGADDYLTKPFGIQEFLARVEALTRRQRLSASAPAYLNLGSLHLDLVQRQARLKGQWLNLAPQEFSLLYALAHADGKPLTRRELLRRAWGSATTNQRTVDSHIQSLRKKIESQPRHPTLIQTVRRVGYRLNVEQLRQYEI